MSDRLTEAMREQENGSREVLTAIKSINTVTIEVQAGSEEMLKGGESVTGEMHKLDELTRIITDSMKKWLPVRYRYKARAKINRRRIFDTLRINFCAATK